MPIAAIALQYGLQYGLPFAIDLIETWNNSGGNPTADDIRGLIQKHPSLRLSYAEQILAADARANPGALVKA